MDNGTKMNACTCITVPWFLGKLARADESGDFIQTIQCPVHGEGSDALAPTVPPKESEVKS